MSETKVVQVSEDGVTFNTLPGSSAEISIESSSIDNSIFGSDYSSAIAGVLSFSFSANAWLRQTPGFNAKLESGGISTAFTTEAMTLVSGKTYKIAAAAKDLWVFGATTTVFDNAIAVNAANIASIDWLFGKVTFAAAYTPTGPITVTGSYRPRTAFGCANSVDLTQSMESVDNSCFETVALNGGYTTAEAGTKSVSVELSGIYREANNFFTVLESREDIYVTLDFEGDGQTLARGVFRVTSVSNSGDQGGVEDYSVSMELSVPEDYSPFGWEFGPTSKAPAGFKTIMNSWLNKTDMTFRYYPTGIANIGYQGAVIVTDASISTAVDAITELSVDGTGNGALSEII